MGWIFSWLALFLIPFTSITTCTMGSEDAWWMSLVFYTPLSLFLLAVIVLTNKHHSRWISLSLPNLVLIPWAAVFVVPFLLGTTVDGDHVCAALKNQPGFNAYPSSWWQTIWAPVQMCIIGGYAWAMFYCWQRRARGR